MTLDFRYRRLGYVALNVSDHARSDVFYREMVGLQAAGRGDGGEHLYRCSKRHHDVVLHQGAHPGLRRVGWEMESDEDWERLRHHLEGLGIACHDVDGDACAALGIARAFRITEPNTGATFEYFPALARADTPFEPSVTKIARLGHVVLGTATHAATERFFIEQLNYRVSDRIDGAVTFLRCFPNPLHHSFGLSNAEVNQLHHVNFMVTDIDDIGRAMYRAKRLDVPVVFGPGRHPPSESVFFYFLDPDGITVEYSFGMEQFPEVDPREPRRLPRALESIDYWGAIPEARFGNSGPLEALAENV
ncbi:MAG: VOC family protein [Gammaproteobacteria bacterium]